MPLNDLLVINRQVRHLVQDPLVSGTAVRSDVELWEYAKDVLPDIETSFPSFTVFTISGSSITPTPDNIDLRLIALKTAQLITQEDWREAVGDSIAIKTGSISLDTTKGPRFFKDIHDSIKNEYDSMVSDLNINGKSSSTTSIGTRVDNYKTRTTDTKAGDSLL